MRMSPPEWFKVDPRVANSFKKNVLFAEGSKADLLSDNKRYHRREIKIH